MDIRIFLMLACCKAIGGRNIQQNPEKLFDDLSSVIVDVNTKNDENPPKIIDDSLPEDLLYIATTKLGINHPEEIPTVGEIGQLLGTSSPEETIKMLRNITSTKDGIALIKAFIDSSDYIDSTSAAGSPTHQQTQNIIDDRHLQPGFFQRMSTYLDKFNLFLSEQYESEKQAKELEQESDLNDYESRWVPTPEEIAKHHKIQLNTNQRGRPNHYEEAKQHALAYSQKHDRHHHHKTTHNTYDQQRSIDELAATVSKLPITSKNAMIDSRQVVATLAKSHEGIYQQKQTN